MLVRVNHAAEVESLTALSRERALAKTIQGAQEMRHALKGWVIERLAFEFGEEAVATVRALGGVSSSPDAGADALLVARIRNLLEAHDGAGGVGR